MTLDRDTARRLATLDRADATKLLVELGLMTPGGLDQLLAESAALIRDDPAIGMQLAELVRVSAEPAGSPIAVARATYLLAQARAADGDMAEAIELIDAARATFERLGSAPEALRTNLGRSQALNEMGRHDEALDACREILARVVLTGVNDEPELIRLVAAAHQNSGLCLELSGRFEESLDEYAAAEAGYELLDDVRALAEVTYDRGLVLLTIGQHAAALNALQRAAHTFRDGGYRSLLVMALANTAEVQLHRGEYQQCLASLAEATQALDGISSPGGEQVRLLVAANAYLALNLLPEALSTFAEAIGTIDGTDWVIDRARARWGHGLALARAGRTEDALDALVAASEQFKRSGKSSWLAEVLVDEARLRATHGEPERARQVGSEALAIAQQGTTGHLRAQLVLAELANVDEPSHADDSIERLQAAVNAANELGLEPLVAVAYHALGRCLTSLARFDEAEEALRTAVQKVEGLRDGVGHELVLARFLDDKLSPYEDLLAVLVARNESPAEALRVGEQAKSRTLTDIVSGLVDPSTRRPLTTSGAVDADLRAIYGEMFSGHVAADSDRSTLLRHRLQELEAQRDIARLSTLSGPGSGTVGASPVHNAHREPGTILISYARAADAIHAFVIDGDSVNMVAHVSTFSTLSDLLGRLNRQSDRFRLGNDVIARHLIQMEHATKSVLRAMHAELIEPLLSLIANTRPTRIVIIPDSLLHDVPFHALWNGTSYLLDDYEIVYAPSLETMRHLPPRRRGKAVVVGVADELAPMVEDEVDAIGNAINAATRLTGRAASWAAVESSLVGAAHVHLAGHALFRPDNPMYSAIRLSDRWVTAADLFGIDLEGATVVLSACETARTHQARSPEINGFVRAFLGAGASTVIASQWTADDRATALFMEHFYARLRDTNPANALRIAQQQVAVRWPHPYFWAPWILVGRAEQLTFGATSPNADVS